MNKGKVTVIGGSGFIGSRLCKNLSEKQIPFEIIDIKMSRSFPEKTKIADIRDLEALKQAVTGTKIVHLAAVHRDDVRDQTLYEQTNVSGTRNICIMAASQDIDQIVFTSSVAVYGFAPHGTGEDGAINPFNEYGKTKFRAEEVLRTWQQEKPAMRKLKIIRPTVVFGEGNRGNVFNLLNQIASGKFVMIGNGKNVKSMAYIENIAAYLEYALTQPQAYSLVNYTDGPDYSMNELISEVRGELIDKKNVGVRLPYWFGMLAGYLADMAAKLTGKRFPISSVRVKKFCATTAFVSMVDQDTDFERPYSLSQGMQNTLIAEFKNPDPDREIFFTE